MARKLSKAATAAAALALALGVAAAVATPALASTAGPAPAPGPTWAPVGPVDVGGAVTAFAAAQSGDATTQWAFVTTATDTTVGAPSVYSRLNNGLWTGTALPGGSVGEVFVSATAISPTSVLAFTRLPGAGGREWQYDGSTWKVIKTFGAQIGTATVLNAHDVWVFGDNAPSGDLGVYHYDGTTWTKLASTLEGGQGLSGSTPTAWAYGSNKVAFYNGKTKQWVPTILPIPGNDTRVTDVWDANGTIYAVGTNKQDETVIFISNGKTWSIAATYSGASPIQSQIANDGQNGIWIPVILADDSSAVLHYILSTKGLIETALPGTIIAIHELNVTHELVGGYVSVTPKTSETAPDISNLANSLTAEIELYN